MTLRGIDAADDESLPASLSEAAASCEKIIADDRAAADELSRTCIEIAELEKQLAGIDEKATRDGAGELDASELDTKSAATLKRECEFTESAVASLTEGIHEMELRRAQLSASHDDPNTLSVLVETLRREIAEDKERYDACMLAITALNAAGKNVRESVAPNLCAIAKKYMERMTCGKYRELGLDSVFDMTLLADGSYRRLDLMSGGTIDIAYIALRLALVRLLYRKELPTLIFDESFSQTDDARTSASLLVLSEENVPHSIVLTCRSREAALLSKLSANGNYIKL